MPNIIVNPEKAKEFCSETFEALGVPREDAGITALNLVEAELRGISSHGLSRMKFYTAKLASGGFKPRADIKIVEERTSTLLMDADFSLGAVAGKKAMSMCIDKAKKTGIACATVRNGNHFGIAAFYSMMALKEDMIGISSCNSVALMTVYGGSTAMLGTNPISIAVPAAKRYPLVFDAATSEVATGKIVLADIEGRSIPSGWAIDENGKPTTDPKAALRGAALPFGGYKGSGLAMMVDVFSGILSGASFGTHIGELRSDPEKGQDVGFFFGAIDIKSFQDPEKFKAKIDQMVDELKASRKAEGVDEIYMPGEIEYLKSEKNRRDGFKIGPGVLEDLLQIKKKYNLKADPSEWQSE